MPVLRLMLRVALAAASLSSCGTTADIAALDAPCTPGVCKIDVMVVNCVVTVHPETKDVPQANNIEWNIRRSPGYTFASVNGIDLHGHPDFGPPHITGSGKKAAPACVGL